MLQKQCPECGTHTMFPTGAYWACLSCRMAITTQAIKTEEGQFPIVRPSPLRFPLKPVGVS